MLDFTYCHGWDKTLINDKRKNNTMDLLLDCARINKLAPEDFMQRLIIEGFNVFDADDSLYGLFNALRMSHNAISPFIATHDYSIKILTASMSGEINASISPIYHLGPDFIEQYKTKNGEELDNNAIIGLISPGNNLPINSRKSYSLGIDAGLAFKNSKISHNKTVLLTISQARDGLFVCLNCESQTTSKALPWELLQLQDTPNSKDFSTTSKVNNG